MRRAPFGVTLKAVVRQRLTQEPLRSGGSRLRLRGGIGRRCFPHLAAFQGNAVLALGGMALARGTKSITDQLFG